MLHAVEAAGTRRSVPRRRSRFWNSAMASGSGENRVRCGGHAYIEQIGHQSLARARYCIDAGGQWSVRSIDGAHRPSESHSTTPAPASIKADTHSADGAAEASIKAVAPVLSRAFSRPIFGEPPVASRADVERESSSASASERPCAAASISAHRPDESMESRFAPARRSACINGAGASLAAAAASGVRSRGSRRSRSAREATSTRTHAA
eukprot:scaffold90233_cov32-Tisochrysis_lutea.AAC.5